jgi:hypothetical protein
VLRLAALTRASRVEASTHEGSTTKSEGHKYWVHQHNSMKRYNKDNKDYKDKEHRYGTLNEQSNSELSASAMSLNLTTVDWTGKVHREKCMMYDV